MNCSSLLEGEPGEAVGGDGDGELGAVVGIEDGFLRDAVLICDHGVAGGARVVERDADGLGERVVGRDVDSEESLGAEGGIDVEHPVEVVAVGAATFHPRSCTHDENQSFQYSGSSGLNGVTVEAGTSFYIHFNNDAAVDADHINRSSIGGGWATPLDSGAYGMGLYINGSFGSGAALADHVQWSHGGVDNTRADERSDEAQAGGVWTDQSLWVATSGGTTKIVLTDGSNSELHGPSDYLVLPDFGITSIDRNGPSEVTLAWPVVNNLEVSVEKSTTLQPDQWTCGVPTMGASTTLTNEPETTKFYRLSYLLP